MKSMKYEWVAANCDSQRVSHSSTAQNADELNCRVRDGYGWNLVALAAETDHRNRTSVKSKSVPKSNQCEIQIGAYHLTLSQAFSILIVCMCNPVRAWTHDSGSQCFV